MSEEEEKVIEKLKTIKVSGYKGYIYNFEAGIVLNLIDKQQEEIEELQEYKRIAELSKVICCIAQNCEALTNCIKLQKEIKMKDEMICKIHNENEQEKVELRLQHIAELRKKDKIIDLMASWLVGMTFSDEDEIENIFSNKEEVKQYFERKVEEKQ